jgi:hypothetical protein
LNDRKGTAILVVMVVVIMMALAAYGFVYVMQAEYSSVAFAREHAQAREACLSGQDYGLIWASLSRAERQMRLQSSQSQEMFAGILLEDDGLEESEFGWGFSIVAPSSLSSSPSGWQFGLVNESSKINLNRLAQWDKQAPGHAALVLSTLPGISEAQLAQLLNALGLQTTFTGESAASSSQQFGAQSGEFNSLNPGMITPQTMDVSAALSLGKRPRTLADLVTQGIVSDEQMWGPDRDRNYTNDQFAISLINQEAGVSDLGSMAELADALSDEEFEGPLSSSMPWRELLTFESAEKNVTFDGQPRVWLNQPNLAELQQALLKKWPSEWVEFVLAYRQFGPVDTSAGTTGPADGWTADLSTPPSKDIPSVFDLIGVQIAVPDGSGGQVILESPFQRASNEPVPWIHQLLDDVTLIPKPSIFGRINVMEASPEVLASIPGIDATLAQQIVQKRTEIAGSPEDQRSVGWLLAQQLVDLTTMKKLAPELTMGGNVFSGQVIGFRDDQSAIYRCTVILSALDQPLVRHVENWHAWGRGFEAEQLRQGVSTQEALSEASGL